MLRICTEEAQACSCMPLTWFSLSLSLIIIIFSKLWPFVPRFGAAVVAGAAFCYQLLTGHVAVDKISWLWGPKPSRLQQSSGPRQEGSSCHIPLLWAVTLNKLCGVSWKCPLPHDPLAHDKRKGPSAHDLQDSCLCCPFTPSKAACLMSRSFGHPWCSELSLDVACATQPPTHQAKL